MRRPSKKIQKKLSADSARLAALSQAVVQAASRMEERACERSLDLLLQKLLKGEHQESIDSALNHLFTADLNAYDALMESVEAGSESCVIEQEEGGVMVKYDALLIAAPVLAWTRFSIASGPISSELLLTLNAHLSAHLLAPDARLAILPTLAAIDQLPRSYAETFALTQRLGQAALKGGVPRPAANPPETAPFLADTRYLLAAVVVPTGAPMFLWQTSQHQVDFVAERDAALTQWKTQATPTVARLLPGCGIELLLPEAYYVACREADKQIRPVSIRAAVNYLTQALSVEADELRAVIAGFGEESVDGLLEEYRIAFTMRHSTDVIYGIVWPFYGQEDDEGAAAEVLPALDIPGIDRAPRPIEEILALLHESGITHIKRHNERFPMEFCDDCGAPLFADPQSELVHAEMPEDTPQGNEHFH